MEKEVETGAGKFFVSEEISTLRGQLHTLQLDISRVACVANNIATRMAAVQAKLETKERKKYTRNKQE